MTIDAWNGSSADWNMSGDWSPGGVPGTLDTGVLGGTGTYTVTIGNGEVEQPGSVVVTDNAATLSVLGGGTLAPVGVVDLAAGSLSLGYESVLDGGTLALAGGRVSGYQVTLRDLTVLGDPGAQGLSNFDVSGGLTIDTAAGAPDGTLSLDTDITFLDSETLDNATLLGVGGFSALEGYGQTLTFGSQLTLAVGSEQVAVDTAGFVNHGTITVGVRGVLEISAPAGIVNDGSISVAAGGTLSVNDTLDTASFQNFASGITDLGALVLEGTLYNTDSTTGNMLVAGGPGALPGLLLADTIVGGTIVNAGQLAFGDSVLDGVTMDGPLVLQSSGDVDLTLNAGTTLLAADGNSGGSLVVGNSDEVVFGGGETLGNVLIAATGQDALFYAPTLTLGAGTTLDVTGSAMLESGSDTVTNDGTIVVASGASLTIESPGLANAGVITIAAGGILELDTFGGALGDPLAITGAMPVLAPGATLAVGESLTPGDLLTLLNGQTGVTVELTGTLDDSGTSLVVGGAGPASLILDGTVEGGSIVNAGGIVTAIGGTLDDVTFLGPLVVDGYPLPATVDVLNGLAVFGTDGHSQGSLTLDNRAALAFIGGASLDNLVIGAVGTDYFDQSTIEGPLLTLGTGVTIIASDPRIYIDAATLTNLGTLAALGTIGGLPGDAIMLTGSTITNAGLITIGSGGLLGLDVPSYRGVAPAIDIINTGSIALAPGATLAFGGITSTAALISVLGTQNGVIVDLVGTLQNGGTVLTSTPTDAFATLTVSGDLQDGVLAADGGTVTLEDGILDGVTVEGSIGLFSSVTLIDGVVLSGADGSGAATIDVHGYSDLDLGAGQTLDNAVVLDAAELNIAASGSVLSIGQGATFALPTDGRLTLTGTSIVNAGTIDLPAGSPYATVLFASDTIVQDGVVTIGSGDILALDISVNGGGLGGVLSVTGSFGIAAGATLALGAAEATGALGSLLTSLGASGDDLALYGTLNNSDTTLAIGTAPFQSVQLDTDLIGGVVTQTGGSLTIFGGTLDNVTIEAPLTLASPLLDLIGTPRFEDSTGGPGSIDVTGETTFNILDQEVIDDVAISVAADAEFTIESFNLANSSITLGSSVDLQVDGQLALTVINTTIASAATISVSASTLAYAPVAALDINAATFVNTGSIAVSSGAVLSLLSSYFLGQFTLINTGAIDLAAGATLAVGATHTTEALTALIGEITGTGDVVVLEGAIENAGTVLDLAAGGSLGDVVLEAHVYGGSIIDTGATVAFRSAVLDDVTWNGPLTLGAGQQLSLVDGLTLVNGTAPGTLALAGAALTVEGQMQLDALTLAVSGANAQLTVGELTLGQAVQTPISGALTVLGDSLGGTLVNDGTIALTGSRATLQLDIASFANAGSLIVGAGDVLGLGSSSPKNVSFTDSGSVTLATGAILEIGGSLTTAQLLTLLGEISNPGVTVELLGTIVNTGATLGGAASALLDHLVLDGRVVGGVIDAGAGSISVLGGTFVDVTWNGALDVATPDASLAVSGGLTLAGAGGVGVGTLALAGAGDVLDLLDAATLDNALISITGIADKIAGATLTFGAGATLIDAASNPRGEYPFALGVTNITNYGTILAGSGGAGIQLAGTSFINDGSLGIGAGDLLELGSQFGAGVTLTGTGAASIAPGAEIEIGGTATTGQILAELQALGASGVTVALDGAVINTDTVLDAAAGGPLGDLILDASVIGGRIDVDTGTVTVLGGFFQGVTYVGTLAIAGHENQLDETDLVVLSPQGGLPGTIVSTGALNAINLDTTGTVATLANVVLTGSVASTVANETENAFLLLGPGDGTVDLARSVLENINGVVGIFAGDVLNEGTIDVPSGAAVAFAAASLTNTGSIIVEPGGILALGYFAPLTVFNTGLLDFQPGAEVVFNFELTTGQFISAVDSLQDDSDLVVGVAYVGTLDNTGTSLTIPSSGSFSQFAVYQGGEVLGGTIVDDGTASFLGAAYLDDVTWIGPIAATAPQTAIDVEGTSTVLSGSTAAASISFSGSTDSLIYQNDLPETISNTDMSFLVPGTMGADLFEVDGSAALTFGPDVAVSASGDIDMDNYSAHGLTNQGSIFFSPGSASVTSDEIYGAFSNEGLVDAAGRVQLTYFSENTVATFANTGSIVLSGGAQLDLDTAVSQLGTVVMADGGEMLRVSTGTIAGTLIDFDGDDAIVLAAIPDTQAMPVSETFSDGVLDILGSSGSLLAAFAMPSYDYSTDSFSVKAYGTGTEITTSIACYVAGTRMATALGETPVEALRIGDRVRTADGLLRPIRWIGHRSYDGRFIAGNRDVLPILIRAGALADRVPSRDLRVSPKHALYLDGVLIPAERLVNGVSIRQSDAVGSVAYYHVELESHDILLAEGAPAESFVDRDSRMMFHNAHAFVAAHGDVAPIPDYAPRVEDGDVLAGVRRRLAQRAGLAADHIDDATQVGPLDGRVDTVDHLSVAGWAFDATRPRTPVRLAVLVDGMTVAICLANRFRADLRAAGLGDGRCAFTCDLPAPLPAEAAHRIVLRRVEDGARLAAPARIPAEPDRPGRLEGRIDHRGPATLEGWARDADHPDLPIRLEVLIGGEILGEALANRHREDLEAAGKGNCGFVFAFDPALPPPDLRFVTVRRKRDGAELTPGRQGALPLDPAKGEALRTCSSPGASMTYA